MGMEEGEEEEREGGENAMMLMVEKEEAIEMLDEEEEGEGDLYYIMEREEGGGQEEALQRILSGELVYYNTGTVSSEEQEEYMDKDGEESMGDGKPRSTVKSEVAEEERVERLAELEQANEDLEGLEEEEEEEEEEEGEGEEEGAEQLQEDKETDVESEKKKKPCPFCKKLLTKVDEHIRLLHRNKVYPCLKPGCGQQFPTLKNLQSHHLTCYNMEKGYRCGVCRKQFHRKSNLKAHVRRHDEHKRFQCQLCDRAFVDSTGLRRHFLKHHETNQFVFVGSCCGKLFKSKEGLKKHMERRVCQADRAADLAPG